MPSITRFAVRSNGRDITVVRRPQRLATARPRKVVAEPEPPLADMLKSDLVSLAESRGVDSSGTKAELVDRLVAHG